MWNRIAIITIVVFAICTAGVRAQEAEKDPFFPSEKRVTVPVPAQRESDWGRDPFANPLGTKAPVSKDRGGGLTGIIYSKNARLAIIGGEVLREGSAVGDKKLVDIRRKSVVLMNASGGYEEMVLEDFSLGK